MIADDPKCWRKITPAQPQPEPPPADVADLIDRWWWRTAQEIKRNAGYE